MALVDNVVNVADLEWQEDGHGENYGLRRKYLAREAGGRQLGCSLYELDPGKRDWPLHFHHGNEEALYFLDGEGMVRFPDHEVAVGRGDYVALRCEPAHAHQVINTGPGVLRFLCISTMRVPDVTEYPEQGKLGVFCGGAPGTPDEVRTVNDVYRRGEKVEYWE
jgi:uncharacterized cupin superfamily protein